MIDTIILLLAFFYGASIDTVIYSIDSLLNTGIVEEDSIFWNCATMGNRVCG